MTENTKIHNRTVIDFFRALKIFFGVIFYGIGGSILILMLVTESAIDEQVKPAILIVGIGGIGLSSIVLAIMGFYVNYIAVRVQDGEVSIPAHDQIRTFTDILVLNPVTGHFRRRNYNAHEIENVANGYTRPGTKQQSRNWNVVITGTKDGKSFSQRIDCTNKQVRDEVRNVLKQAISGKVNSEFSY